MSLQIGQVLYGYCKGYFGRGSYDEKRVEAVGVDWVVVRETDGTLNFVSGGYILADLEANHTEPEVETI